MAVRSQEMRNPTMGLARPKNMGLLLRRWGMPTLSVGYISAAIVGARALLGVECTRRLGHQQV